LAILVGEGDVLKVQLVVHQSKSVSSNYNCNGHAKHVAIYFFSINILTVMDHN